MDYNTDREKLILPEYGRNVQNMIDYALSLKDRAERQRCATTIVKIMGQMYPAVKEMPDANQVLWDHLARMSHYKMDIDYPVEITEEGVATAKPAPMPYPMTSIRFRHYGHLLESLLTKLSEMEEGPERDKLVGLIANQMRKNLFYWNKDVLNEAKIASDIARYTNGKIQLQMGQCRFANNIPNNNFSKPNTGKKGNNRK